LKPSAAASWAVICSQPLLMVGVFTIFESQKPLAEARGVPLAITIRAFAQPRRS
jgi:hypothetical protein